jgi:beta-glucosidase/6-phospho-beta-glucosidase/beta-galactosidase
LALAQPQQSNQKRDPDRGIFPTFFIGGFECSTFVWKDGKRKNYIEITGHDRHMDKDCQSLKELGFGVAREAIPWPFVDLGNGKYDWSHVDRALESMDVCNVTAIWDLFHYGLPDNCNPLEEDCHKRFLDYCRAVADHLKSVPDEVQFFTPVNEITFFAGACTDMGWMYPFAKGKYVEMKRCLCKMAIEGAKAIREIVPGARMVNVDPIIHTVPPKDRPDLSDEAEHEEYVKAFEAWDMLYGKLAPELGGSPEILDIIGLNVYNFSQAQMNADGSREVLGPRDPRRKPLSEMLKFAWERYHRPVIIGETSGYQDKRAEWLRDTMEECLIALNAGVDLQAVTLYPCVDIPDWNSGEWAKIGIYDIDDKETCERIPHGPYIDELRRWQQALDQPESVEADGGRVELEEVRRHAKEWESRGKSKA